MFLSRGVCGNSHLKMHGCIILQLQHQQLVVILSEQEPYNSSVSLYITLSVASVALKTVIRHFSGTE